MKRLTLILPQEANAATDNEGASVSIALNPVAGETLSQSIYLSEAVLSGAIPVRPLCSGLGRCGLCRIRFLDNAPEPLPQERKTLGQAAIDQGWRLSCLRLSADYLHDDSLTLELPSDSQRKNKPQKSDSASIGGNTGANAAILGASSNRPLSLALDIGTSSIHWSLLPKPVERQSTASLTEPVALADTPLASGIFVNPQMGAGADIVSRLAKATDSTGRQLLQALTIHGLKNSLNEALAQSSEPLSQPEEICLAANSAMTLILLNKDVSGLLAAPYHLDYTGGCTETLPGLPPIWVAPLLSPFVGGDISAGVAALLYSAEYGLKTFPAPEYPFLLADLGTNGEFALCLSPHETLVSSVPMGPALEGIGLSCGGLAGLSVSWGIYGVATTFKLSPFGLEAQLPDNDKSANPQRLSATGYLSLLRHLLQLEVIDDTGLFREGSAKTLAQKALHYSPLEGGGKRMISLPDSGKRLMLGPKDSALYLSSEDVEELLKVKAAFSLAVQELLKSAGLQFSNLKKLYLAGALGKHVQLTDLEALGFLPSGGALLVAVSGNTALAGAELFIKAPASRERIVRWTEGVRHLELASAEDFTNNYLEKMRFGFY